MSSAARRQRVGHGEGRADLLGGPPGYRQFQINMSNHPEFPF